MLASDILTMDLEFLNILERVKVGNTVMRQWSENWKKKKKNSLKYELNKYVSIHPIVLIPTLILIDTYIVDVGELKMNQNVILLLFWSYLACNDNYTIRNTIYNVYTIYFLNIQSIST